ncbi:MAG: molybdenum cofactor guanylyltransferase MobA [Janthinobacterium lividum]
MTPPTLGVILAGGLARRMGGGDKGLHLVGGERVLDRLIRRVSPQVAALAVNANDDPARFADLGLPVVPDTVPDRPGPLAGVIAGLDWAAAHSSRAAWIVTLPGDCPFVPSDLVARLHEGRGTAELACAASGGWTHPVVALWPLSIRDALRAAVQDGMRKIDAFTAVYATAAVEWPATPVDPFFNVNTPSDLAEANRLAAEPLPFPSPSPFGRERG